VADNEPADHEQRASGDRSRGEFGMNPRRLEGEVATRWSDHREWDHTVDPAAVEPASSVTAKMVGVTMLESSSADRRNGSEIASDRRLVGGNPAGQSAGSISMRYPLRRASGDTNANISFCRKIGSCAR
jgi:hypothetical protein